MNRVNVSADLTLHSHAFSWRSAWIVALGAILLATVTQPPAHAITLNMTYFNEGDPVPHDENPTWDPDGTILKAHFQAAKAIWEYLLPGGGSYDFEFEWDDNIDGLGLTTGSITGAFIEIHPSPVTSNGTPVSWFADPTPNDNAEFNAATQRLYSQLSASDQSFYFPGTAPPGGLEVNFQATGIADSPALNTRSASGQNLPGTMTPVDANNGNDLLSTILHEIGHVLGIAGVEPGDYNIDPQHVGGLNNVLVLEGGDGHLGGGPVPTGSTNIVPGFLMCNSCGVAGLRRYATATDVLVIAEDQGITVVQLARVGRISGGLWSEANYWIGGDVPDATQDVYVSYGGNLTVDEDFQARSLLIAPGNGLYVQFADGIAVTGALTYTGGTVDIASTGTIAADQIIGDPAALTTAIGSLVRFNQFTRGTSSATSATFNGSVAIGYYIPSIPPAPPVTFNPGPITTWTIAENLKIGDERDVAVAVSNATWNVGGNVSVGSNTAQLTIQTGGTMTVGGNIDVRGSDRGFSDVTVETGGTLNVTGNVIASPYGRVTYKTGTLAADETFDIQGGVTVVVYTPPTPPPRFVSSAGGRLTIEGTANVVGSTFNVDGGTGNGAPGGVVIFTGDANTTASNAQIRTKGGHKGGTSPFLGGLETPGNGGLVRFEGSSSAWQATIENEGVSEYFGGTGGRTIFADNSTARDAIIHNHGATHINGGGGVTQFRNSSTAESADIFNHADGTYYVFDTLGATAFFDSSNAGTATIENQGSPSQSKMPGRTEFRNNSSAANATINNRGYITVGDLAGRTFFYDSATAGNATLRTYDGYSDHGRIEFYNQSTAASARIFIENEPMNSASAGGYLIFYDGSTAAQSEITLRAGTQGTVQFYNNATAANSQIITETGTGNAGNIIFNDNSTAGNANISLGESSVMTFYSQSTAANATISLANKAQVNFSGGSAGQANITAAGGSVYTAGSQAFIHITGTAATAANSTITVNGASATLASPAAVHITGGASPGNATLIANGGTNGGAGGTILFNGAANGSTARLVANAGALVDFFSQAIYNDISFGSIEGAGTFHLRGAHVITGSRNTSTTVSGPIVDTLVYPTYTGGRLTKVGTGTLTLAGVNTYSGFTTINAGTVSVTGSIAGGAIINNGGILNGTGTIVGGVAINSGGVFAPGTSPGTITIDGLSMMSGGMLNFELGDPARDHIILTGSGNVALAGILNVSLLDGFMPTLGQSFALFEGAVGSITGAFDSIIAPTFNGLTFDVMQTASSVLLQVGESMGDFNRDGFVNAADYVVWRKGLGTTYTQDHYNVWRVHYGETLAIGAGASAGSSSAPVPEPAALLMILMGMIAMFTCRRAVVS
ncbi:MAG: autotransporter-associated beta strand repeat-containing protein [Pirellulales bacterium]